MNEVGTSNNYLQGPFNQCIYMFSKRIRLEILDFRHFVLGIHPGV